ncbi:unnamed protein product [Pleuronectes platessa]|uniref:Uncharacterized protein n=1 Tax=Pleuronectes platessa TaxID=8262 RepID=A0A9N7Z6U9_PLEPL|nr:unnamed protein product [Pleuronectes platessa]
MQDCEGNGNDLWAALQLDLAVCRDTVSPMNSMSPNVTPSPHRGSCCQPCLAQEQHQHHCLAKNCVCSLQLQPEGSRVSRLSDSGLSCQRSDRQGRLTTGFSEVAPPQSESG